MISKVDLDFSAKNSDKADHIDLVEFNKLTDFFKRNSTLPVAQDGAIMDILKYFPGKHIIIDTNLMIGKDSADIERTLVHPEDSDMDTKPVLNEDVQFDTFSSPEYVIFHTS